MNEQNLKRPSPAEARENGRKGGLKRAENARRIKENQERWLTILDAHDETGLTNRERLDRALIRLVIDRDPGAVSAYEKIKEYAGESVLLELKREEQKIRREELRLRKAELELKKAQAEQKNTTETEIQESAIRARAAIIERAKKELQQ